MQRTIFKTSAETKSVRTGIFHAILFALVTVAVISESMGQTDYGTIAVVINPPTSNVTVALIREGNTIRTCTTKEDGRCVFAGLDAGPYTVRAKDSGSPVSFVLAVLNVPGGGSSIAAYRPDLIPGVNPYVRDDRNFLNPAAFTIPVPGRLGNLSRGALRGPGKSILDLSLSKKFKRSIGEYKTELSFNVDFTNVLNHSNFKSPPAQLEPVLGTDVSTNQLQPGQPFMREAAATCGILNRTFKRKTGLGSSRQVQLEVSLKF
jgi:hypothetical protein